MTNRKIRSARDTDRWMMIGTSSTGLRPGSAAGGSVIDAALRSLVHTHGSDEVRTNPMAATTSATVTPVKARVDGRSETCGRYRR